MPSDRLIMDEFRKLKALSKSDDPRSGQAKKVLGELYNEVMKLDFIAHHTGTPATPKDFQKEQAKIGKPSSDVTEVKPGMLGYEEKEKYEPPTVHTAGPTSGYSVEKPEETDSPPAEPPKETAGSE